LKEILEVQSTWEERRNQCGTVEICLKQLYIGEITRMENWSSSTASSSEVVRTTSAAAMTPAQQAQQQAIARANEQMHAMEQQTADRRVAAASVEEEESRFNRLNTEKQELLGRLRNYEDLGPLPAVEGTRSPTMGRAKGKMGTSAGQTQQANRYRTESDKMETQIPMLRTELKKREDQALAFAQDVLRGSKLIPIAEVGQLESLIASVGKAPEGPLGAYQAARTLDNGLKALTAAKQRAEKIIAASTTAVAGAARYASNPEIAGAARSTTQALTEVGTRIRAADPKDEPLLTKAADKLNREQGQLVALTHETVVLSSTLGKQVNAACTAWATRQGMITSNPVRVFKDDETNKAAERAYNYGRPLCSCMTVEIAGDDQITDQAKLEIAKQFETRNRMDNQQLAAVVAVADARCQIKGIDELSGGQLSRSR
jgi:hypothetical protein